MELKNTYPHTGWGSRESNHHVGRVNETSPKRPDTQMVSKLLPGYVCLATREARKSFGRKHRRCKK